MTFNDSARTGKSGTAASLGARAAAGAIGVLFVLLQLWTIGYGTSFNDAEWIQHYQFDPGTGAAMEDAQRLQPTVVTRNRMVPESVDKQMLRFKLYSINPDEHMSIIALRRIRPAEFDFDPDYFQYGGGFLYPLGVWFFALSKMGVLEISSLDAVLNSPSGLDRVYILGRLLVLISFALSAWVLYRALLLVADPWSATWAIGIYMFAPVSIMFSVLMKPHWFWMLWIAAALYVLTRGWVRGRFRLRDELWLGLFLGLTLGVAPMNPVPVLLGGVAVLVAVWQRVMDWPGLFRVPAIAAVVGFLSSPFFILSWQNIALERAQSMSSLKTSFDPIVVWNYLTGPLVLGFGGAFVALLIGLALYRVWARKGPMEWWAMLCLGFIVALVAVFTAGFPEPENHTRYISYFLPIAVLFAVRRPWPRRRLILAVVFALTVLQSVPLKVTYVDGDSPDLGTRHQAAAWIAAKIPSGARVCPIATIAPYSTPPIDLTRYRVNKRDCEYLVAFVLSPSREPARDGYQELVRFVPRLWSERLPLILGFANPPIKIYRRAEPGVSG